MDRAETAEPEPQLDVACDLRCPREIRPRSQADCDRTGIERNLLRHASGQRDFEDGIELRQCRIAADRVLQHQLASAVVDGEIDVGPDVERAADDRMTNLVDRGAVTGPTRRWHAPLPDFVQDVVEDACARLPPCRASGTPRATTARRPMILPPLASPQPSATGCESEAYSPRNLSRKQAMVSVCLGRTDADAFFVIF